MADKDRIGALWRKGDGKWFSGTIEGPLTLAEGEKLSIVVFSNDKTKETQPDFNILKARKREDAPAKKSSEFDDEIPGF
jgi:uncharacterized protein (DUF1684 family)